MSGEAFNTGYYKDLMKLENVKHKKSRVPRVFKANLGAKEYIHHFGIAWDSAVGSVGEVKEKNWRGLPKW